MGARSRLLVLVCTLCTLPANYGAQQKLSLDASRVRAALETFDPPSVSAIENTIPAEMSLKCKTTCTLDVPNVTRDSNASTCARCLDQTASDLIDRVISTQEKLTAFRIKARVDRSAYSRKEETRLTSEHEAAVLQLRGVVAPAKPEVPRAEGSGATGGQAATLKAAEQAKMKQTSSHLLGGSSVESPAATESTGSSSNYYFSPRQECYRVCGHQADIRHDQSLDSASAFVELESQMLSEEFSSMGTLEQCVRLYVQLSVVCHFVCCCNFNIRLVCTDAFESPRTP